MRKKETVNSLLPRGSSGIWIDKLNVNKEVKAKWGKPSTYENVAADIKSSAL